MGHAGPGSTKCDADRTATFPIGTAAASGQRFRVPRPHARGGLGAVFVALDEELHRGAAQKQVLDRHADDPMSRQRFLVEAEIAGAGAHGDRPRVPVGDLRRRPAVWRPCGSSGATASRTQWRASTAGTVSVR